MVWHQAVGNDANSIGLTVFFDLRNCEEIICRFAENRQLASATVVDVINHPFLPKENILAPPASPAHAPVASVGGAARVGHIK
jgi:hypothetical protein